MSAFSLDWLRLREPFDLAARDPRCATRFASELGKPRGRPLRVLDLAAGSGASFRALAPVIGIEQSWALLDHDSSMREAQPAEITRWAQAAGWRVAPASALGSTETLRCGMERSRSEGPLAHAPSEDGRIEIDAGSVRWVVQGRGCDLECELDALDFTDADGVTTSAFLDLVSQAWLDRFASKLAASRRPLLATLNVDGLRLWRPALAGDEAVQAAFERHQSGDKGFGPALGPAAGHHLAATLKASDYQVTLARSDWRIGPAAPAMLRLLLEETLRAAVEAEPTKTVAMTRWGNARRAQLAAGSLSLRVGHLDVLALPAHAIEPSR